MHLVEIRIFSLNNVTIRPTKIMNRADKNWAHLQKIKYLRKKKVFRQKLVLFFIDFFLKRFGQISMLKKTLKIRNLRCSRRLSLILISLTVTYFHQMHMYVVCTLGLMYMVSCPTRSKYLGRYLLPKINYFKKQQKLALTFSYLR